MRSAVSRLGLLVSILLVATVIPASASTIAIDIPNVLNGDVDSLSFDISGQFQNSSGQTIASKVSISEIKITKKVDNSSPTLFNDAAAGTIIPSVSIDLFKTSFSSTTPYEQLRLTNAIISSYQTSANNQQTPEESLSFDFQKITFQYFPSSKTPLGAFLPLSTNVQLAPFSFTYDFIPDRLDNQLQSSDIVSADTFAGTVPEPGSFALLGTGLLGMLLLSVRSRTALSRGRV